MSETENHPRTEAVIDTLVDGGIDIVKHSDTDAEYITDFEDINAVKVTLGSSDMVFYSDSREKLDSIVAELSEFDDVRQQSEIQELEDGVYEVVFDVAIQIRNLNTINYDSKDIMQARIELVSKLGVVKLSSTKLGIGDVPDKIEFDDNKIGMLSAKILEDMSGCRAYYCTFASGYIFGDNGEHDDDLIVFYRDAKMAY
jgi:hypothetical protein